jgi:hypothetical protein
MALAMRMDTVQVRAEAISAFALGKTLSMEQRGYFRRCMPAINGNQACRIVMDYASGNLDECDEGLEDIVRAWLYFGEGIFWLAFRVARSLREAFAKGRTNLKRLARDFSKIWMHGVSNIYRDLRRMCAQLGILHYAY